MIFILALVVGVPVLLFMMFHLAIALTVLRYIKEIFIIWVIVVLLFHCSTPPQPY